MPQHYNRIIIIKIINSELDKTHIQYDCHPTFVVKNAVPELSCRCLCLMTARPGLLLCGGGSGLSPQWAAVSPPLCLSSSRSLRESVRGMIISCLLGSICLSVCCLEDATWPLIRESTGASEMVVDLSKSWSESLMSQVLLLPSESNSAPMQLYTILTRSVDYTEKQRTSHQLSVKKNGAEHEVTWRLEANKLSLSGSPYLSLAEAGGAGGSQSVPRWPLQKSRRGHVPVGSGNSALWPHNVPRVLNHWVDVLWGAAGTIRPRNKHFFIVWVQSWPWRRRKY